MGEIREAVRQRTKGAESPPTKKEAASERMVTKGMDGNEDDGDEISPGMDGNEDDSHAEFDDFLDYQIEHPQSMFLWQQVCNKVAEEYGPSLPGGFSFVELQHIREWMPCPNLSSPHLLSLLCRNFGVVEAPVRAPESSYDITRMNNIARKFERSTTISFAGARDPPSTTHVLPSATQLYEAGIEFRGLPTGCDIE